MKSTIVEDNGDDTYTVVGGNANDGDNNVYVVNSEGQKSYTLGESLTSHSFFGEDGEAVVGAVIDMNSTEGQSFIDNEIVATDIGLFEYMSNAKGGEPLDFKVRGINDRTAGTSRQQHVYRGSVTSTGKIGSARDFGNVGAGIVAGRTGYNWGESRMGFDALQSFQEGRWGATEGVPTQKAQRVGHNIGTRLRSLDGYYRMHGYHSQRSPINSVQIR